MLQIQLDGWIYGAMGETHYSWLMMMHGQVEGVISTQTAYADMLYLFFAHDK